MEQKREQANRWQNLPMTTNPLGLMENDLVDDSTMNKDEGPQGSETTSTGRSTRDGDPASTITGPVISAIMGSIRMYRRAIYDLSGDSCPEDGRFVL